MQSHIFAAFPLKNMNMLGTSWASNNPVGGQQVRQFTLEKAHQAVQPCLVQQYRGPLHHGEMVTCYRGRLHHGEMGSTSPAFPRPPSNRPCSSTGRAPVVTFTCWGRRFESCHFTESSSGNKGPVCSAIFFKLLT